MYVRELVVSYRPTTVEAPAPAGELASGPQDAVRIFTALFHEEAVEVFGVLCLTTKQRVIGYGEIGRGAIAYVSVSPREVFQVALLANATAVVLGHNHPSGSPLPSPEDGELTRSMACAGRTMNVEVLDHIIVGHDGQYYSFKEAGRL